MYRINTPANVANTGRVHIDTGDGVQIEVPVLPTPTPYFSGVRDVTSLVTTGSAQWARLIRSGDLVELYVQNWDRKGAASNSVVMTLPPGFRAGWTRRLTSSSSTGYPYTGTSGAVQYNGEPTTTILYGSWITPDAPPTTLPGTPV